MLIDDVPLDIAAHGANQCGLRVSVASFGTAAEAGAKAGLLGGKGVMEETDVFATGTLRGAGRPAEDSRAGDGEYEGAVLGRVAIKDGLPAAGFSWRWDCLSSWFRVSLHRCILCKYRIGSHADNIRRLWWHGLSECCGQMNFLAELRES
jgi:hypothetical protein